MNQLDMPYYAALVTMAKQGEISAFEKLYELYYADMFKVALFMLRRYHDAEDVVSETITDAFASISKLQNAPAFKSWLFKILYTKIKRAQKNYVNEKNNLCFADLDIEDSRYSAEQIADCCALMNAISALGNTDRLIVILSVVSGYNSNEIGTILNMLPATARSRLSRSLKLLKKELSPVMLGEDPCMEHRTV